MTRCALPASPTDKHVLDLLTHGHLAGLVGSSTAGRSLLRSALDAAAERTAVLVHGPRGAGKRAFATAVHRLSGAAGPLAVVPLGELPAGEHHDRLFGGDDGPGLWRTCIDGTLVLAELDALSDTAQRGLVRHLDSGRGPRVIALTRRGRGDIGLRAELTWRLALRIVDLPHLRDRDVDIELIAQHHLARLGPDAEGAAWRMTLDAVHALRRHTWPGNIRELLGVLDRATDRAGRGPIRVVHLGLERPPALAVATPLADVERQVVEQAMAELDGNVSEVGRKLEIPRSTLYRKLKRWGIR